MTRSPTRRAETVPLWQQARMPNESYFNNLCWATLDLSFVGDMLPDMTLGKYFEKHFYPCKGDLIISRPAGRYTDLPNSLGYIASFLGDEPPSYKFKHSDLVLRIGDIKMVRVIAQCFTLSNFQVENLLSMEALTITRQP